ncbi:hypothetical protein D3C79_694260 [compost metagenome]
MFAPEHVALGQVDAQAADHDQVALKPGLVDAAAAQQCAYPGQQHPWLARFGHVVVGAHLQAQHLVMAVVAGGQHQDRQGLGLGAQQPAHLQAIEAGQHQVEDHQVRLVAPGFAQHMVATGNHIDTEVVALQVAGDQFGQGAVIFDQENIGHG